MPILKKPIKKKTVEVEDEIPMFHAEDHAFFTDDGKEFHGKITIVDGEEITIEVGDDSYQVTPAELTLEKEPAKLKTPIGGKAAKSVPAKGKGDDFAEMFNKTNAAATGGMSLPVGKHNAVVTDLGLRDSDKGLSGFIKYQVMDADDAANENSGVSFYQLINADGEEQEGFGYFKRELVLFGLDESETISTRADLEDILESIAKKELYVEINVREKGGFTNIFLNQVLDQDDKP